jgi:hypothetical protein
LPYLLLLQSLNRESTRYVLTVGARYHEADAEHQKAIVRRVLEVISASDRTARVVAVMGPRGESLGVLSVGSFRRNPSAI